MNEKQGQQLQIQSRHSASDNIQQDGSICQRIQVVISQFKVNYDKQFESVQDLLSLAQIQKQIFKKGRIYKKQSFQFEISETILSTDYESISLQLHYGFYAMKVNIINIHLDFQFIDELVIGKGQFGTVYQCTSKGNCLAIKATSLILGDCLVSSIKKIYKQYFLAVLASQLQIGPKIIDAFGYNIVFMGNKAFFSMQKCTQPQQNQIRQPILNNLKKSLHILHELNIVHKDIKPANICWSSCFQKFVFIDFGLSSFIKQPKGTKSFTKFVGTYAFCNKDMQRLFMLKQIGYVDFYFNDLTALRKSIEQFKLILQVKGHQNVVDFQSMQSKTNKIDFISDQGMLKDIIDILRIKKINFENKFQHLIQQVSKQDKMYKSCLEILLKEIQGGSVPKSKQEKWKKLIQNIQQKIIAKKCVTSKTDDLLSDYIKKVGQKNLINHLISLQYVFQNQINDFQEVFNDKQWIQRIFYIINPRADAYLLNKKKNKLRDTAYYVINKIYKLIKNQDTAYFVKKLRFVLLFLYEKIKQQKNIKLYEQMSDLFLIIGDQTTNVRIKRQLIENTKNILQYCLLNLKYYIYGQNSQYFATPSNYTQYLDNILNLQSTKRSSDNQFADSLQIQLIAKHFANFLSDTQTHHSAFQIYSKIYRQMLGLNQKLLTTEFHGLMTEIIQHFSKLFLALLNQILISKPQLPKQQDVCFQVQQIVTRIEQSRLERGVLPINVNNFIFESISFCIMKTLTQQNDKSIQEMIKFYFQVVQGSNSQIKLHIWEIILNKIQQNNQFGIIILQLKLQWIRKKNLQDKNYNFVFLQLKSLVQILIQLKFSESQIQKNAIIAKTEQIVKELLTYHRKMIQNYIKSSMNTKILNYLVNIIQGLLIFSQNNQNIIISKIVELHDQLMCEQFQKNNNLMQISVNRITFLGVLIRYKRHQNMKINSQNQNYIQNLIIQIWQLTDFPIGSLTSKYMLSQIIQIYNKNQKCEESFVIIMNILKTIRKNKSIYNNNTILNLREGFYRFIETTTVQIQRTLIQVFMKTMCLKQQMGNQDCYLLFLIVFKTQRILQPELLIKLLCFISRKIDQLNPIIQKTIRSQYFAMYMKKMKQGGRKGLSIRRIQSRYSCQNDDKKNTKLIKIISQKANWINRIFIRQKLISKIHMLDC